MIVEPNGSGPRIGSRQKKDDAKQGDVTRHITLAKRPDQHDFFLLLLGAEYLRECTAGWS